MSTRESKPDLSRLSIDSRLKDGVKMWPLSAAQFRAAVIGGAAVIIFAVLIWFAPVNNDLAQSEKVQTAAANNVSVNISSNNYSEATLLYATGYVVASRQAAVASKATGRLKSLNVEEGDTVKTGDVLGVLENDDVLALVKEREANVEAIKARIRFAEAELEDATLNRDRAIRLESTNVVSRSELDQAKARYKKALSDVETSKANLGLAEAQLERSRVDLSYTFVIAPFDGTVLSKNADVGEIVAPLGSSANARAAIVTIANMNSLEVEADVSEANITKVFVGQECEIVLDSYPDKRYAGKVSKIVPTVDRAKATVLTKIKFIDRDDKVLPEMSAKVAFKLQG